MDISRLPDEWRNAFRRDLEEKPPFADPRPEHRLARLLGAFVMNDRLLTRAAQQVASVPDGRS